jgi:hypothetical protein
MSAGDFREYRGRPHAATCFRQAMAGTEFGMVTRRQLPMVRHPDGQAIPLPDAPKMCSTVIL